MKDKLKEQDYKLILELKELLVKKYGSLIEQIYFFGSRVYAQKEDADYDILIITNRKIDWHEEREIYSDIFYYQLDKDIFVDPKFFSSEEIIVHAEMPFIKNVFSYGIPI